MIFQLSTLCINIFIITAVLQFMFWSRKELERIDAHITSLQQGYIITTILRKNIRACGYFGPYTYLLPHATPKIFTVQDLYSMRSDLYRSLSTHKIKANTSILVLPLVSKHELELTKDFDINSAHIQLPHTPIYANQILTIFDNKQARQFKVIHVPEYKKSTTITVLIHPIPAFALNNYIFTKGLTKVIISETVLFYVAQTKSNKYSLYRHNLNASEEPQAVLDLIETFTIKNTNRLLKINLSFAQSCQGKIKNINKTIAFTTLSGNPHE